MARFDRYLIGRLMVVFGFFALILVAIYWINRAVALFDRLIGDGQSALVFLEFTALTLPNVIRLVLPMAAFAASVYVANRLTSESELVVMQATGYSHWRLIRPVAVFGVIVGVLLAILTNVLVPASWREYNRRNAEIERNATARFLTEGTFLHPGKGVTFYIREISREGELRDVFLSDATQDGERTAYSAKRALLVRSETGPKLVMFDGTAQRLTLADRRLSVTSFEDFSYDIASMLDRTPSTRPAIRELPTLTLLAASPETAALTGAKAGQMVYEGLGRINEPLGAVIAAIVGFATLLLGSFSRFGLWRQIVAAILVLIVLKSLDNAMGGVVRSNAALWPLTFAGAALGVAATAGMLWVAARPALFVRRRQPA